MEGIPADLGRFLEEKIESIDQLEVLRILGDNPDREWGVAELATEVQTQPQTLTAHLAALESRGLLRTTTSGGKLLCRHGPPTPEMADLVKRLLQLYRERPVTLIKMVYARAGDKLRAFADAFRIRKEG